MEVKKVLIDTNLYSRAMNGDQASVKVLQKYDNILISPIVLGELTSGFRRGKLEEQNLKILEEFLSSARVFLLAVTYKTSEHYGIILNKLRSRGTPIPTNDIWIAASAKEHGAALATHDAHFNHIKDLKIKII